VEAPPYEPPAFPLNEAARRALVEISDNREARRYDQHLAKSASYLRESVGAINDVLIQRRTQVANWAERRNARGETERALGETQAEERLKELESLIPKFTDEHEEALRHLIFWRAELEDEKLVFAEVQEKAAAQQPRPEKQPKPKRPRDDSDNDGSDQEAPADEDEDEGMDDDETDYPPLTGVGDMLETSRKAKRDEFFSMSAYQRYGLNNDYISFKKMWHDAQHPDDQVPLPDASTWFDELGRPTKTAVAAGGEDDDLVLEREIIDLKCRLTLQTMKEPYSNHQCPHTFEKSAILEFLRASNGKAACPVCDKELRVKDLYLDELVLRKLKRAEQAASRQTDDSDGEAVEDDPDASMTIQQSDGIKRERGRPRRQTEDVDDE